MRWSDALRMAATSLVRHKFRTILTMLGLVIGVAAVILLSAIGNGAEAQVTRSIETLGSNLIFVSPAGSTSFTLRQAAYVQRATPMARQVVPVLTTKSHVAFRSSSATAAAVGTTRGWFALHHVRWATGGPWLAGANRLSLPEAVLGHTVAQALARHGGLVGHHITLLGQRFLVAGVLAPGGQGLGSSQASDVFVPLSLAQNLLRTPQLSQVIVGASSPTEASLATNLLTRLYALRYGTATAVQVGSEDQLLATVSRTQQTFTDMLFGTSLIALLVGGIGIMNIMLVSVRERTREIGVRTAVGAHADDVVLQFLLEAIATSVAGGLAGMALGAAGAGLLAHVLQVPVALSTPAIFLAFGVATLEGLVFGLYPSIAAARLDPIQALRYDG